MTLLHYAPQYQSVPRPHSLQEALDDLVHRLRLGPGFRIQHPDYQIFELPEDIVQSVQQMPAELQSKYRSVQLQTFLYGIYYNGSLRSALALDTKSDPLKVYQNLENNTFLGVDLEFYERLHASNCGVGYFDPYWQVMREESDGSLVVTKQGLRLYIERDRHLQVPAQSITIGQTVAIRLPKSLVQNGFYMAVGNQGTDRSFQTGRSPNTIRIYFNLTPEGAVAVMADLTHVFNQAKIPFVFKVLYNPSEYDRFDSGVLYLDQQDYRSMARSLQSLYLTHRAQFRLQSPLFTKILAPGLALAEEPSLKFTDQESFGQNRCRIVANALLETHQQGQDTPDQRMTAIVRWFNQLGLNLNTPYLNANSEDHYPEFELCAS